MNDINGENMFTNRMDSVKPNQEYINIANNTQGINKNTIILEFERPSVLPLENHGENVVDLQRESGELNNLADIPDGIVGSNTKQEESNFPKNANQLDNRIADDSTWSALNSPFSTAAKNFVGVVIDPGHGGCQRHNNQLLSLIHKK